MDGYSEETEGNANGTDESIHKASAFGWWLPSIPQNQVVDHQISKVIPSGRLASETG
jgi:hypothetical protein